MGIDLPLKPKRWETQQDEERRKERETWLLTAAQPQFDITFFFLLNFINQVPNYSQNSGSQHCSLVDISHFKELFIILIPIHWNMEETREWERQREREKDTKHQAIKVWISSNFQNKYYLCLGNPESVRFCANIIMRINKGSVLCEHHTIKLQEIRLWYFHLFISHILSTQSCLHCVTL